MWQFLTIIAIICGIASQIKIPVLVCRTPIVREVSVEIVNVLEQMEEIDHHSSRIQFLGPRNEVAPENLQLPEWEEMEYVDPDFVIP
ncbi:MAG: hypothetical protein LBJ13_03540 [Puniceicoccales bacterium]|nr:hypothetical protein [Puniceicoccales bacterium]